MDAKTGNLYTADPVRQLLFSVSADGGRVTSVDRFPAPGLKGLACGPEGFFWSSDGEAIYKHAAGKQNSISRKYAVPGLRPDALYWDGRTLWAADSERMSVDRFLPGDRFSSIGSIRVPGKDFTGLAADDDTLWVLDAAEMKVYRCRLPGGENPETLALGPLLPKGARAAGLAVAGGEMWILTDKPAELRRYSLSGLRFRK
ncbi:MAG: hypothetical protein A3J79_14210 [Elusimicrobia bacterium RIFOXYB2_FULL_62_6]|nr:MAG: hypothetical protein A3J79_14210 [Elusimicrobia bacterium RIFOXYB2_FULL_62_6]